MASKPKQRRFTLRKVNINTKVTIGALAADDVVGGIMIPAATESYLLTSVNASYAWLDSDVDVDDGLTFGLAHGDYTDAEIEECLEASGAIDLGDKLAQEKSNRLVREIGSIGGSVGGGAVYNDGRPRKTKLNWRMTTGKTVTAWVRNNSGSVWTTSGKLGIAGKAWIRDL